jgi:hypothetical protein
VKKRKFMSADSGLMLMFAMNWSSCRRVFVLAGCSGSLTPKSLNIDFRVIFRQMLG